MSITYKVFRGTFATWATLFDQAAEFAGSLPPASLVTIAHSSDELDGVVTVWYRTSGECLDCGAALPSEAEACISCGQRG